jgi:hypothetical protein
MRLYFETEETIFDNIASEFRFAERDRFHHFFDGKDVDRLKDGFRIDIFLSLDDIKLDFPREHMVEAKFRVTDNRTESEREKTSILWR